jgi:rubredoxin
MICPKCGYAGRTGWKEIVIPNPSEDDDVHAWQCPACDHVFKDYLASDDEHRENKRHGLDR